MNRGLLQRTCSSMSKKVLPRNLSCLTYQLSNCIRRLILDLVKAHSLSIRINDQWRICFEWRENDAYEVEITDYH